MKGKLDRRQFLLLSSSLALSALASRGVNAFASADPSADLEVDQVPPATADRVIWLWMAGGMAHTETFDPKPHMPFKKGLESRRLLSTFPTIDSAVDDIKLSAGLERVASVMDRGAIIRSVVGADFGAVLHTRHQFHWHTGYTPPLTVAAPHIGSMITRTLGPLNDSVPAFVDTGQDLEGDGAEEIRAFMTAGFLGADYSPFRVPDPFQAIQQLQVPGGMTKARLRAREQLFRKLNRSGPVADRTSDFQKDALERSMERAHRLLLSPDVKAFDISQEPESVLSEYNTSQFGLGCLLARRLAEAGSRFVEVSSNYVAFGNWDTHNHGHSRTTGLKQWIDAPVARLILDLEERGLLDRTLVVLASEFSRTAGRNPGKGERETDVVIEDERQYGMHRHFAGAGSVVLFGGGIRGGTVYGQTADEYPCAVVDKPVSVADIHATIYRALGISPKLAYEVEKRPFFVTDNGKGKPIEELFA